MFISYYNISGLDDIIAVAVIVCDASFHDEVLDVKWYSISVSGGWGLVG